MYVYFLWLLFCTSLLLLLLLFPFSCLLFVLLQQHRSVLGWHSCTYSLSLSLTPCPPPRKLSCCYTHTHTHTPCALSLFCCYWVTSLAVVACVVVAGCCFWLLFFVVGFAFNVDAAIGFNAAQRHSVARQRRRVCWRRRWHFLAQQIYTRTRTRTRTCTNMHTHAFT